MKKTAYLIFSLWIVALICLPLTIVFAVEGDIHSSSKIPDLQLQIPVDKLVHITDAQMQQGVGIAVYLVALYGWLISAITMLAVVFIMAGGIIWLTAAGSSERIGKAKKTITNSLWGLAIALGSYLFLSTISSNLVNFKSANPVEKSKINSQIQK